MANQSSTGAVQSTGPDPIRVFISYSHDSPAQLDRVWDLCERLRKDGIDCRIDQHEVSPADGFARWCRDQVLKSNFVLVVCTETYNQKYEGETAGAAGWEGFIIGEQLYQAQGKNEKFVPVLFASEDSKAIPFELQSARYFDLSKSDGYENLLGRLQKRLPREPTVVVFPARPLYHPIQPRVSSREPCSCHESPRTGAPLGVQTA